ncbi:MAG: ATP-dependent sacrificial sulfur transferase LarE [Anaerolineae bacterium]|nr:ATP-dependent sacrificial sulfur transferase LarE [Anaerolineae bacterium]MDW8102520.1 ATP-dependent sacrificial sulfur transferase LarE [Anaerolineae bacterium]
MEEEFVKEQKLLDYLSGLGSVVVALSGGVDSSFLLWAALKALGPEKVLAVTLISPVVPARERRAVAQLAEELGARHLFLPTDQINDPQFLANPPERCYFCKKENFSRLIDLAREEGFQCVVEGSNTDDDRDFRPGAKAVKELGVLSPLKEVGLSKEEIRRLSRLAGLPTWDKPPESCLATRFPRGTPITLRELAMVEKAEDFLISLGLKMVRVRHHYPIARIEVGKEEMGKVVERAEEIASALKAIGYTYVVLDLEGYRPGGA